MESSDSKRSGGLLALGFAALVIFCLFAALELSNASNAPRNPKKAIWGPSQVDGKTAFPIYKKLGISIYSMALDWSRVAATKPANPTDPNDPAYKWPGSVTGSVREAGAAGLRVSLTLTKAPTWANGGKPRQWAPTNPSDYANFATAAAKKFPNAHLWMVWGEPTRRTNFMPYDKAPSQVKTLTPGQAQGPRRYARILDAAYEALKSPSLPGSDQNLVIGGSTFTAGDIRTPLWLKYMRLPNGMPPRLDLYGHNVFSTREPDLQNPHSKFNALDFSEVGLLEKLVTENLGRPYGKSMIPLFISEWCVPTSSADGEFNYWVDPPDQAKWIKSAFDIVNGHNFIYALGWIHLSDERKNGIHPRTACGLLNEDGSKKQGFDAFRRG